VYVLVDTGSGPSTRVIRFDPAVGTDTSSTRVSGGEDLALAGGSLWVSAGEVVSSGKPASRDLLRLDPISLAVRDRLALPTAPGDIVATDAGLWVASVGRLYLVDLSTGEVAKTVPVRMTVGRLAYDPVHDVLYDSLHTKTDSSVRGIEERDASTGSIVVGSYRKIGNLAVNALAATSDGVWSAEPTGMLGQAHLYERTDLKDVATIQGTNGLRVDVADGVLWLADGMAGTLRCAGPETGRIRTWIPRVGASHDDSYESNVVALDTSIYVGALNSGLVRVDPGKACGTLTGA
jgi:hypothetical protein